MFAFIAQAAMGFGLMMMFVYVVCLIIGIPTMTAIMRDALNSRQFKLLRNNKLLTLIVSIFLAILIVGVFLAVLTLLFSSLFFPCTAC